MYHFSKLSSENRDFITQVNNSGNGRHLLTSLAIAKAIADSLPMIGSKQDDIKHTYRLTHEMNTAGIISRINEMMLVDCDVISELVRNLYIWRYRVAFDPVVVICTSAETAIEDFFSTQQFVDRNTLAELKKDPAVAMRFYNNTRRLVAELLQG